MNFLLPGRMLPKSRDIIFENYYENGTGSPTNNDNHYVVNSGESIDYYEGRNNYQLPAYHRLDLGIKIYRPKKERADGYLDS